MEAVELHPPRPPMSKRQKRGEPKPPSKMTIEQWHVSNDKLVGIEGQIYGKKGYCDGEDFHTGQIVEHARSSE